MPARLKVGLVLFAGEAQVATPPTTDHALVAQAVDDADYFRGFGGTAIGDAIATAVQVGLRSAGLERQLRHRAAVAAQPRRVRDGEAARGEHARLDPLPLRRPPDARHALRRSQGADKARAAGIPVYTVALGTTGNTTMRGFPGGFPGGGVRPGRRLRLRPAAVSRPTRRRCTRSPTRTGGKFFRARSAGAVRGRVLDARLEARPRSGARSR